MTREIEVKRGYRNRIPGKRTEIRTAVGHACGRLPTNPVVGPSMGVIPHHKLITVDSFSEPGR